MRDRERLSSTILAPDLTQVFLRSCPKKMCAFPLVFCSNNEILLPLSSNSLKCCCKWLTKQIVFPRHFLTDPHSLSHTPVLTFSSFRKAIRYRLSHRDNIAVRKTAYFFQKLTLSWLLSTCLRFRPAPGLSCNISTLGCTESISSRSWIGDVFCCLCWCNDEICFSIWCSWE